jgi:phage terminase large subunit GpA-like protein
MILPEHREALLAAIPNRDSRPIWAIADGRYGMDRTRPAGEKWQLSRTPWWKQPLDDFRDDNVREIVIMAGSQCSKTAGMLVALGWAVKNNPAPMLWITGNDDLAKDASQERVTPTLERCPDSAPLLLNNRLDKTTWKIRCKTCTVDIAGAQSSTALEQNPYRFVFGDEVRQWPTGSLQKVEKRQRSFGDAKRCFFSTPMLQGDEFHQRYLAGTQCEWVWPCMKCGVENKLEWKAVKYAPTSGEITRAVCVTGNVETTYIACAGCGAAHGDSPSVRRHIIEAGHWQAQNPTSHAGVVSYHWNALLPPWVRWADLVAEWKQANDHLKRGNPEPLKVFVCETLGEPWQEREVEADPEAFNSCRGDYSSADEWDAELKRADGVKARVIGADVQQDVIYWRCRLYGADGASRGHGWGRVFTFAELDDLAKRLGVNPKYIGVDSGYRTTEVYRACLQYGWKATKGEDREQFIVDVPGMGRVRQAWNRSQADPHSGTAQAGRQVVPLYLYADPTIQDMLALQMAGKAGHWTFEADAGSEYVAQLCSEEKRADPKTGKIEWVRVRRANHLRDCEKIASVIALASGILKA